MSKPTLLALLALCTFLLVPLSSMADGAPAVAAEMAAAEVTVGAPAPEAAAEVTAVDGLFGTVPMWLVKDEQAPSAGRGLDCIRPSSCNEFCECELRDCLSGCSGFFCDMQCNNLYNNCLIDCNLNV
ncbi:MAG: hypothetical protein AAGD06_21540 [Acidobacteriota bacterium]